MPSYLVPMRRLLDVTQLSMAASAAAACFPSVADCTAAPASAEEEADTTPGAPRVARRVEDGARARRAAAGAGARLARDDMTRLVRARALLYRGE